MTKPRRKGLTGSLRTLVVEELESRRLLAYNLVESLFPPETESPFGSFRMGESVAVSDEFRVAGIPSAYVDEIEAGWVGVYGSDNQLITGVENPDPEDSRNFGNQVALSDNGLMAVSASFSRIFIFDLDTGTPQLKFDLLPQQDGENFASSIAMHDDLLVVGARRFDGAETSEGVAYIYDVSGSAPLLIHTLNNPTPEAGDFFGNAVAIDGDQIAVSAVGVDLDGERNSGEVYIFEIGAGVASLTHTISNPAPLADSDFGTTIAIESSTAIVGAPEVGFVYAFDVGSSSPLLRHTIENPEPYFADDFGASIAYHGGLLLVGTPNDEFEDEQQAGTVYQFDLSGTDIESLGTIFNPSLDGFDNFGSSIAMNGDAVLIGAETDEHGNLSTAGAVHAFNRFGFDTAFEQTLDNPTPIAGDAFGSSVAINDDRLVVFSQYKDLTYQSDGEGYVYQVGDFNEPPQTFSDPIPFRNRYLGPVLAQDDGKAVVVSRTTITNDQLLVFDITASPPVLLSRIDYPGISSGFDEPNIVLSGSRLAVANPTRAGGGRIYIYDLNNANLSPAILSDPNNNGSTGDFGREMAISGTTLVVGSPYDRNGPVYVYRLTGTPSLRETFYHPDPPSGGPGFFTFGNEVAIDGSTIAVTDSSSRVYVFDYDAASGVATHTKDYTPWLSPFISSNAAFGASLAISDNTLFVGAPRHDSESTDWVGLVAVLDLSGPSLRLKDIIENPTPAEEELFGTIIDAENGTLVVGVPSDGTQYYRQGAAYIFQEPEVLPGDFDADGFFNCSDIDALTTAIASESTDLLYDINGDSVIDIADRDAWLFEAGAENLEYGFEYSLGDANLDGVVDVSDFNIWNTNKFSMSSNWCSGDFSADGVVDVSDFNLWNGNKFESAASIFNSQPRDSAEFTEVSRIVFLFQATEQESKPQHREYKVIDAIFETYDLITPDYN